MNPTKATRLRALLSTERLDFILEAHNALSARIAEEAGFPAIWASGLTISASLGVRDNNEASWTQVLEVAEFMADATSVPILLDGDTGFGNFNNFRRVVKKLCARGIGGVCIEDKLFPKTNSFLREERHPLADVEEFCGRLRAARDAQTDPDFVLVARTEALIAGWGVDEALRRADAYRAAGADAIVVHSARARADEIVAFLDAWRNRAPVILIPTKYFTTPVSVFAERKVAAVIWANHLLRAGVAAMQATAARIRRERSVAGAEETIAPLAEIFRLQGDDELREAETRYLSAAGGGATAIILAATRGKPPLAALTHDRPKTLLPVGGVSLLERLCRHLEASGVQRIALVAGYRKEAIARKGLLRFDNDAWAETGEVASLACAQSMLQGPCLIVFGDVLCRRQVLQTLLLDDGDIVLAVDRRMRRGVNGSSLPRDLVRFAMDPADPGALDDEARLLAGANSAEFDSFDGEWIGVIKLSARGAARLHEWMRAHAAEPRMRTAHLIDVVHALHAEGQPVKVRLFDGGWHSVEIPDDLAAAGEL